MPRAIAWNSLAWQTASIIGPAAGGLLIRGATSDAYFTTFGLYVVAAILFLALTIPLARFTDHLIRRDQARRLAGAAQ